MSTIKGVSTAAAYQVSGLASGIDSAKIVDALVEASSVPLKRNQARQADYQVQITTLGSMISQLKDLQTKSEALAKNGTVAIVPNSTYSDFTVTGSAKSEGSFDVRVEQLAKEAKIRWFKATSAQDAAVIPDGKLQFAVEGVNTVEIDTTGKTLADVAEAINQNISSLSASVVSTGDGYYLNIARKTTGFTTTSATALTVVQDAGQAFDTGVQAAQNAIIHVDGLKIEKTSNTITNAIQGITLNLTKDTNTSNRVVFVANSSGTAEKLQTFIDAYNTLAKTVRDQLVTDPTKNYGESLVNGTTATAIQRSMQRMLSQTVMASGSVRTLADLGMEIQRDGSISLNTLTMTSAIEKNPEAVNSVFSNGTTGIATIVKSLVKQQTAFNTGVLTSRRKSLETSIADMDEKNIRIQSYLDKERARLTAQFTAMEQMMGTMNSIANYLTNQSKANSKD